MLLLLYDVPDMEFLLHFGDGCTNGLPVISWNACKQHPDAGFTMPSYSVWMKSLGPQQLQAYHSCLQQRCVWRATAVRLQAIPWPPPVLSSSNRAGDSRASAVRTLVLWTWTSYSSIWMLLRPVYNAACLPACPIAAWLPRRYPADQRRPLAVWRGSTTDTKLGSFNKDNYMQVGRSASELTSCMQKWSPAVGGWRQAGGV